MSQHPARQSVLVIDNHDSYTYNLVQSIGRLTGTLPDVIAVDKFRLETEDQYDAIVVSPGPGHPSNEPSFDVCLQLFQIRTAPILGVCLGHQGLIMAHGGSVGRVEPAHGVVSTLIHDGAGLFEGVDLDTQVVRYHSLAAHAVPDSLRVSATTSTGLVMAVEHRKLPHYGVQFHPESVLTAAGDQVIANFLQLSGVAVRSANSWFTPTADDPTAVEYGGVMAYPSWIEPDRVAMHVLRGKRRAFWLDSADRRAWTGRHSVLGYLDDNEPSVVVGDDNHAGLGVAPIARKDFLSHLARVARDARATTGGPPAVGGWVGVAGYETQEILPSDATGTPADGFFMKTNRVVVFDHHTQTVYYRADNTAQLAELRSALDKASTSPSVIADDDVSTSLVPISEAPWAAYQEAYALMSEALRAGDSYEGVLTFPLDFSCEGDPLDQYLALRKRNPAPFAAYLRHDTEIVLSASPERLLAVDANATAEMRPIKGTLPRSSNPEQDALARWRLATADKVRRENLMITDLVRNDLGRVSEPGSVLVSQLMGVETYQGVHQLVSAVTSRLRPGISPVDCLRAVFPAGSMTGAPKKRTMELIRGMEWRERGIYSGALGWFDASRADFSVVIRTLHGSHGHLQLNVGGGIIVGSTAESEFAEAMDKARSVTASPTAASLVPS